MDKKEINKRPLLNERYDVTGNSISRVFRHQLLSRCIPMGNYRGGAGFKCLLIFTVLHYMGRPMFRVLIHFERQVAFLYRVRERLQKKD